MSDLLSISPFEKRVWLASPTMHGEELQYIKEAFDTNWVSTVGANIDTIEKEIAKYVGCKYAVALSCGTSAIHLAVKYAGVKPGDKVFCSDLTFDASANPIKYEGAEPIFIDTEYDTWNMDPKALEKAFELYPEVKVVVVVHLYGVPCKMDEIRSICYKNGATIIEDAAESFGAKYKGIETGNLGDYNVISFNGNKIITGSTGGMFLTNDIHAAESIKKWSTQSREDAPWYQHKELGYNYRVSNLIAGVIRGQLPYLNEHLSQKKDIYMRYKEGLKDLPVSMNPYDEINSEPNFWLSCLIIDKDYMSKQRRSEKKASFVKEAGKSCPTEIYEVLKEYNVESRPIWKPMHLQPFYSANSFLSVVSDKSLKGKSGVLDCSSDIYNRGLCLPSDNKMSPEVQDIIIELIKNCFV